MGMKELLLADLGEEGTRLGFLGPVCSQEVAGRWEEVLDMQVVVGFGSKVVAILVHNQCIEGHVWVDLLITDIDTCFFI